MEKSEATPPAPAPPAPRDVEGGSTTGGLPIAPSLTPALDAANVPVQASPVDARVVMLCGVSIALGIAAAGIARLLVHLIAFVTQLSFHGRATFSLDGASPWDNHLGLWVIVIPAIGGIVVGFMARYGSRAIRGHGIPEAMEQVLLNQSRIPARLTFLKPLSAAVAIGTGGPFGAEGPIIATGGALGSLIGQISRVTADERKTLLAAGAAAGMAAIFGAPVSAVLLAIELLLFEFRPRSIIPVALASVAAAAVRAGIEGSAPVFAMPDISQGSGSAMAIYIALGAVVGVASVIVTRLTYFCEDAFEKLPIHWMWWPALGGLIVGAIGYFYPRTLGVGYSNISDVLSNKLPLALVASLCVWKCISWAIALGSGTSGGTLAPLFTIGGALGALIGAAAQKFFPSSGVDVRIAALVGMAAIFAGASRALLTSVVFAFETTLQPLGLLPLLGGCSASFLISALLMRHSIMTEKIVRRGTRVPAEYHADFLDQILVREVASRQVVCLRTDQTIEEVRRWIEMGGRETEHQGFPVVDSDTHLVRGVLTRRDLLNATHPMNAKLEQVLHRRPSLVYDDCTLREAADHMVNHDVGRLPVTNRNAPGKIIGIITRSDVLRVHRRRLDASHEARVHLALPFGWRARQRQ